MVGQRGGGLLQLCNNTIEKIDNTILRNSNHELE
jgi:hypothetical protein